MRCLRGTKRRRNRLLCQLRTADCAGFGCVRRLRSTGSCNGSTYDSTHGSIRTDARSSTLGGTAGERQEKIVALLLAIFLGQLGIHNFYLGYTKKGIIQLCVSLLLSWTYVAPLAIWIWALVEGINAFQGKLPDADGRQLSD